MDYATLKDRLNFILNNDDTQTHPAFSAARLQDAMNWAYRDEMRKARLECNHDWLFSVRDVSWPADQVTLALPEGIKGADIQWIQDVTNNDPGYALVVGETTNSGIVHWKDRNTLQWGTNGPDVAKTLRFAGYFSPTSMVEDGDTPDLLPEDYHELIVWSAAIFLHEIADRSVPGYWQGERNNMRTDLHKLMSKPRPGTKSNRPRGGPGGGTYLSDPYSAPATSAGGGLTDVN